jgi:tRNA pseudouridine55 synthase
MTSLNGWIILDKPHGLGSTQAVRAVKRALREGGYAKVKIGHGGTLDPLATGVLPIALGSPLPCRGEGWERGSLLPHSPSPRPSPLKVRGS